MILISHELCYQSSFSHSHCWCTSTCACMGVWEGGGGQAGVGGDGNSLSLNQPPRVLAHFVFCFFRNSSQLLCVVIPFCSWMVSTGPLSCSFSHCVLCFRFPLYSRAECTKSRVLTSSVFQMC
jgi:hypothetical protein